MLTLKINLGKIQHMLFRHSKPMAMVSGDVKCRLKRMTSPNFNLPVFPPIPLENRSFPIHCLVDQEDECTVDCPSALVRRVCDTYVVLPASTLFCDLIRAALAQLSFPTSDVLSASGSIQFRNWKPLPFSAVTEDQHMTVEQIFSDVFSAATVRILLSRRVGVWTDERVRAAVVKLLREHTQSELASLSPLSQPTISNIANSRYRASLSEETCRAFGEWYDTFKLQEEKGCSNGTSSKQRLTYHPIYELPLMREWFRLCPNPTHEDLQRFTDQLNSTPTRKERVLVSPSRLRIWWINEKQRMRRCIDPGINGGGSRGRRKRFEHRWEEPVEQNDHNTTDIDVGITDGQKSFTVLR